MNEEKKENKWSNQEWDSTWFMVIFLVLFGIFIFASWNNETFRNSELAGDLVIVFAGVLTAMANHFFNKRAHNRNGNGSPQTEVKTP